MEPLLEQQTLCTGILKPESRTRTYSDYDKIMLSNEKFLRIPYSTNCVRTCIINNLQ